MITWIASYPRSGNTYLRVLLRYCFGVLSTSIYTHRHADSRPSAGKRGPDGVPDASPLLHDWVHGSLSQKTIRELAEAEQEHFVKTHELPSDAAPALYLVRDGRDSLVSYAHHILQPLNLSDDRPAFVDTLQALITRNESFGGWGRHITSWTSRAAATSIIRFEDLVQSDSPLKLISAALTGIGSSVAAQQPLNPVPLSCEQLQDLHPRGFRRGKVGGWRDDMPDDLHELFWQHHGDVMTQLGYSRSR